MLNIFKGFLLGCFFVVVFFKFVTLDKQFFFEFVELCQSVSQQKNTRDNNETSLQRIKKETELLLAVTTLKIGRPLTGGALPLVLQHRRGRKLGKKHNRILGSLTFLQQQFQNKSASILSKLEKASMSRKGRGGAQCLER